MLQYTSLASRSLNWSFSVVLQASALQAAAFHPDGSSVAVGFKQGG